MRLGRAHEQRALREDMGLDDLFELAQDVGKLASYQSYDRFLGERWRRNIRLILSSSLDCSYGRVFGLRFNQIERCDIAGASESAFTREREDVPVIGSRLLLLVGAPPRFGRARLVADSFAREVVPELLRGPRLLEREERVADR